jgi:glycerate kinase
VFGPQKGADAATVEELERRLAALEELAPYARLPGAGAAGGLGAALASLGAELVPGAPLILERIGFLARARESGLVVTGEGTVDRTTASGKAPGEIASACRALGVRCVLFGGLVHEELPDVEVRALSGRPEQARDDLVELGEELALLL